MRAQTVRWKIARRHLNQRRRHPLRWIIPLLILLFLITGAAGAGTAAYLFASQLPPASAFRLHVNFQDARIYDSQGDLLFNMSNLSGQNGGRRIVEPLQGLSDQRDPCRSGVNRIPLVLQDATIATEDATFYKNLGFDPLSIVRAAYQDMQSGRIVSGASTITQQLVRDNMLTDRRSLNRKAEEVALAYEINKRFSKRTILWYYLNSVPYGDLAYGAQAAAHVYFNRPVCSLDLAQAAMLAGLPNAPTSYNPVLHRAAALDRMYAVLKLMRKHGYIYYRSTIDAAMQEARLWRFQANSGGMRYPAFVHYVISQLRQMPVLRKQLYSGIDVYTTLDPRLQDLAQRTVTRQISGLVSKHVTDGSLVSLDLRPGRYGWINAMVGSANYRGRAGQINMALSPRQPGSSMKPFNYIWAFTHGNVFPGTTVQDAPLALPDPNDTKHGGWYQPTNYDHRFHGTVTMRLALANSLNVSAVKTEFYITTPAHVASTAVRFGMTHLYSDNPGLACKVCFAVTLGGLAHGTRLLEETSAYGVFASGGVKVPPVAIWKVISRSSHRVLYCSESCPHGVRPDPALQSAQQRVLDAAHAYEMTNILSDNGSRCTVQLCEFGLNSPLLLSRPAAAKTGTTNSWTDNWTVGYVPQLVTGVWVGNADHSPMIHVIGITGAAPIWQSFMEGAFRILRLPARNFAVPPGVEQVAQCSSGRGAVAAASTDIFVPAAGSAPGTLPKCSLPDRGFLPIPCNKYPSRILPAHFRCPSGPRRLTYTYRCTTVCVYTYSNGQQVTAPLSSANSFFGGNTANQGVQPGPANIPQPPGQNQGVLPGTQ